jgi:hypothetical protein
VSLKPGWDNQTENITPVVASGGGDRSSPRKLLCLGALAVGLALAGPHPALAFSLFGAAGAYCDVTGVPTDHWHWSATTITFKFDPSFNVMFPDPSQKDQVRLAFRRWSEASSTAFGPTEHFDRTSTYKPFGDLRSITLHELGHVLGLTHPDEADLVGRNYQPAAHVCPSAESGQPDTGNEVMQSIINPGWYRHILTWDELDGNCFIYNGSAFNFVEVADPAPADIVISTYVDANPNVWAHGGPSGVFVNAANHALGAVATSGSIQFNRNSGVKMGYLSHGINWDYLNTSGQPARSIQVRTRGTDNPNPRFHYDNNDWPHPFLSYATTLPGASAKDDVIHTWSNPSGGDIPAGDILHVGLELDVYDWTVVSAIVKDSFGIPTSVGFVSFHDWNNAVYSRAAAGGPSERGLRRLPDVKKLATGFRLVTPDVATRLSNLAIADVTGMHLTLPQLNRSLVQELARAQRLQLLDFPERDFKANSDFIFVLEGSADNLPPEVRTNQNFIVLNRPDLAGKELLVFAVSTTPEAMVSTYALLGNPPVQNAEVPGLVITRLTDCVIQVSCPDLPAGYVLQSTRSLTPPIKWNNMDLPASLVNGLKSITISNACEGNMFFRLARTALPTYSVLSPGIAPDQFKLLAQRLHLPESAFDKGVAIQHTDITNFANIPTELVGPAEPNEDEGKLSAERIRFDLLKEVKVLDEATAINLAEDSLGYAGLRPAPPYSAWPEVGHAQFTAVDASGSTISDQPIDTQVRYTLQLGGLPLVGSGAKIGLAFDDSRNVTRLSYALRRVQEGQLEPIIAQQEADAQALSLYGDAAKEKNLQLSSQLVYYAPPAGLTRVSTILPYYQYDATLAIPGAKTKPVQLRRVLIPAVASRKLVPTVTLNVNTQGGLVLGQASVSGGAEPYTYEWNSSSTTLNSSSSTEVSYTVSAGRTNPITETLTLVVTDANGVRIPVSQTVTVSVPGKSAVRPGIRSEGPILHLASVTDVGTEWVGTSMGLGGSAANANGFVTRMAAGGSAIRFNWGDYSAWERDFKDPSLGGTDSTWVDNADAVFYTGHANDDGWYFPGNQDDTQLRYSDARYGQNDLEWLVVAACGPLQFGSSPNAWWQRWGQAFKGLHLLCGYQTVTWDNTIEGQRWADYMLSGWTVRQAWMQTGKDVQGASERVAVMGVYDLNGVSNWNDHFWGRGSVGPDIHSIGGYWMVSSPCD